MENASKALLMSAGVLMGVIILSLIAYLSGSFGSSTKEMKEQMEEAQIENYNSKFYAYDRKEELTIYDIYTVVNLAKENNSYYELTGQGIEDYNYYIAVFLNGDGKKGLEDQDFKITNDNLKDYMVNGKLKKYKCNVYLNTNTGRVNLIKFTSNNT